MYFKYCIGSFSAYFLFADIQCMLSARDSQHFWALKPVLKNILNSKILQQWAIQAKAS